jgi:hypothetical protein
MYNVTSISIEKKLHIIEHQLDDLSFVDNFKTLIDNNISDWSYKTNVKGKMTNIDFFCKNDILRNIFTKCNEHLKYFSKNTIGLIEAWGNILEGDEEVIPHIHYGSKVCGILYLTEGGPGTYFEQFNKTVEEKIGKIVFFSPEAKHGVVKSNLNNKRYTLAFNFYDFSLEIQKLLKNNEFK